jgi:hypothetical protein
MINISYIWPNIYLEKNSFENKVMIVIYYNILLLFFLYFITETSNETDSSVQTEERINQNHKKGKLILHNHLIK